MNKIPYKIPMSGLVTPDSSITAPADCFCSNDSELVVLKTICVGIINHTCPKN